MTAKDVLATLAAMPSRFVDWARTLYRHPALVALVALLYAMTATLVLADLDGGTRLGLGAWVVVVYVAVVFFMREIAQEDV